MNASLKQAQLQQVARLLGKTRTGTKSILSARIAEALETSKPIAPGTRILSIDLGIRNLAYSLLEVPTTTSHEPPAAKLKKRQNKGSPATSAQSVKPILHTWERLALIPKTPAPVTSKKRKSAKAKKTRSEDPENHDDTPAELPVDADKATIPVIIEDFSPTRLSAVAVDLILNRLLPLKPDIITLEQQRFRSMGGFGVYEWTLRVNSLESMLYAVFTTLQRLGQWPGGRVEGVVARNVLEFMVLQEQIAGVDVGEIWGKDADNKKVKKAIVGRMLGAEEGVSVGAAAEPVAREYLDVWHGKIKGQQKSERLKKLDDLADCLLQGIAFIRWQENKRKLMEGGVKALQDQMIE